ncbi:hypothetical protein [Rahnella sikkimica]|uniref:Uncharacterized protein n=1 Tax=Rahnella sikkimica TaxID=1805933 RepID=A0A2L1UYT8_9GAMM|nr:hypothetical protein [Rahnella sikkimica]AVF38085.1 hypothetical protein BV494_24625 [Rahnella sikkimica]
MTFTKHSKQVLRLSDETLKAVSLYLIFFGLLVMVAIGASWGVWGFWFAPLSLRWFIAAVVLLSAGCFGLLVLDVKRCIRKVKLKLNARKGEKS